MEDGKKKETTTTTNKEDADGTEVVTQSFPPSHILQDGRFIYLPPPNEYERSRYFERTIAKYGLLEADMAASTATKEQKEQAKEEIKLEKESEEEKASKKDEAALKVHPLAVASARLQSVGIAELNRAINLSTLVNTGEYFGLTNIVDPTLELIGAGKAGEGGGTASAPGSAPASNAAAADGSTAGPAAGASSSKTPTASIPTSAAVAAAATPNSQAQKEMQEEQRIKSAYVLKRKRAVFEKASRVLLRHQARLEAAIEAQTVPDQRIRQLRPQWRLVAPEHGTRAKPHAVRPTEVVAVDVDVYDPMGGASGAGTSLVGRLASKVPRYATIELTEEFCKKKDKQSKSRNDNIAAEQQLKKEVKDEGEKENLEEKGDDDAMDIDLEQNAKPKTIKKESSKTDQESPFLDSINDDQSDEYSNWTIAEPFAIADPTLGKISADFDPNKVTYLTLQFDIEKPSTGFCMSSCLESITTTTVKKMKEGEQQAAKNDSKEVPDVVKSEAQGNETKVNKDKSDLPDDEQVLVSLQHSLFCAKLFEAIRKEIMGDDSTEENHTQHKHASSQSFTQAHHSVVWLTSENEENFLPPPSVMVQPTTNSTGASLCVVHCHASEVKVQLDSEYTLRAKLVEVNEQQRNDESTDQKSALSNTNSGSQMPEQLLVLCRSLLLHAQEAYHKHSLQESFEAAQKQRDEQEKKLQMDGRPEGLDRIQKKDAQRQPKILQSVVGLGTKMLFEQRIRKSLMRVRHWLQTNYPTSQDSLKTEWLSLSLFDLHSHFCLSYGSLLTIDVTIVRDEMTLTSYGASTGQAEGTSGQYRKVKFHSDAEFEIFLKIELRRLLRRKQQAHAVVDVGAVEAAMPTQ